LNYLQYIGIVLLFVIILFFSAHIIQYIEINGFESLNELDASIIDNPFDFSGLSKDGILTSLLISFILSITYIIYVINTKSERKGKEHGSAEWGSKNDSRKLVDYIDKKNNVILTRTEVVSIDTRKIGNINIFVVGGPGSGKTRFFIKPNLMQMNSSFVVTDPKGEILRATGKMMENSGYKVKVLNLVNMRASDCYNPFSYIREDKDVIKVISTIMKNTTPVGQQSSDPFWEKSETALLQAIVFYLFYEAPVSEQNFNQVMILLRAAEAKEDDENYKSKLDILFDILESKKPEHIALKQYKIFKQAAGKTAKSILVSIGVRLAVFNIDDVNQLTFKDTMEFSKLGDEKTILYVITPDSDHTFNFIAAMLFTQLIDTLYYKADFELNGSLNIPVRFKMDEFPNIGTLPNFDKVLATCRSRKISFSVIIQSLPQIKEIYKNNWGSIIGNCDIFLFLGGQEQSTLEYVSKFLGKSTIHGKNTSFSRGRNSSSSLSEYTVGRDLLTPDEVRRLDREKCVLIISGMKPFISKKFKIEKHKNFKLSGDFDENNNFNVTSLIKIAPKLYKEHKKNINLDKDDENIEFVSDNDDSTKDNINLNKEINKAILTKERWFDV
jgi:type IV secretion system protein VirD4